MNFHQEADPYLLSLPIGSVFNIFDFLKINTMINRFQVSIKRKKELSLPNIHFNLPE